MYIPFPFYVWVALAAVLIGLEVNSVLQHNMAYSALTGLLVNKIFAVGQFSEYLGGPHTGATFAAVGALAKLLPDNYHKDVFEKDLQVCGITVRQFSPKSVIESNSQDNAAILFVHGGGWTIGDIPSYRYLIRHVVHKTGAIVFAPDYTLAPVSQYPQPLDESVCVMKWMHEKAAESHISRSRLATMGDSAGGNLATTIPLKLYADKRNKVSIKQQILLYPCVDPTFVYSESSRKYGDAAVGLTRTMVVYFWSQYLGTNPMEVLNDKYLSPLKATLEDLKALPPAYIVVAEHDVLRSDGEAYAAKLKEAGVATELSVAKGFYHAFGMAVISDDVPGADIIQKMLDYVKNKL